MAPYDSEDARGLLKAAIRDPDPIIFLENELIYGTAFPVDEKVRGRARQTGRAKQGEQRASRPARQGSGQARTWSDWLAGRQAG